MLCILEEHKGKSWEHRIAGFKLHTTTIVYASPDKEGVFIACFLFNIHWSSYKLPDIPEYLTRRRYFVSAKEHLCNKWSFACNLLVTEYRLNFLIG